MTHIMRLKELDRGTMKVYCVHPTWKRSRPDDPNDLHAGWYFAKPNEAVVPLSFTGQAVAGKVEFTSTLQSTSGLVATAEEVGIATPNCEPDTFSGFNCKMLRDLYEAAGDTGGARYSTPVLWDLTKKTIVNNESSELLLMLNNWPADKMTPAPSNSLDLYPEELRKEIDEVNEICYEGINNGVYKCGFAQRQAAYDVAAKGLQEAMDKMEERMSSRKFLVGERLTLADVRLFPTLVRMDEVYVVYFKTVFASLHYYPNLMRYTARILQMPAFGETLLMDDVKQHYFTSHPMINSYAIIPRSTKMLELLKTMKVDEDAERPSKAPRVA